MSWLRGASPLSIQEHVVVEAVLDGRPVAQAAAVEVLHGFSQDMGAGVPVHLREGGGGRGAMGQRGRKAWVRRGEREDTYGPGVFIVEAEQLQGTVPLQRSVQVPQLSIHPRDHSAVSKALAEKGSADGSGGTATLESPSLTDTQ